MGKLYVEELKIASAAAKGEWDWDGQDGSHGKKGKKKRGLGAMLG